MTIATRANRIQNLLGNHLKAYTDVVGAGGLSEDALGEMKDKAKGIIDDAKAEVDLIKAEVDSW